ncbi:MAG: hypothetical protein ABI995_15385, partial [Acidobacteriota bacterium]
LDRAVALIKEKAKISASDKITLVPYPQKRTLTELLLNREPLSSQTDSALEKAMDVVMSGLPWRSLAQGGVLQTMPYSVVIK